MLKTDEPSAKQRKQLEIWKRFYNRTEDKMCYFSIDSPLLTINSWQSTIDYQLLDRSRLLTFYSPDLNCQLLMVNFWQSTVDYQTIDRSRLLKIDSPNLESPPFLINSWQSTIDRQKLIHLLIFLLHQKSFAQLSTHQNWWNLGNRLRLVADLIFWRGVDLGSKFSHAQTWRWGFRTTKIVKIVHFLVNR